MKDIAIAIAQNLPTDKEAEKSVPTTIAVTAAVAAAEATLETKANKARSRKRGSGEKSRFMAYDFPQRHSTLPRRCEDYLKARARFEREALANGI
jgi:hypothetical protein